MVEIPRLTKEQEVDARNWRIEKCGSASFKELFAKFGKECSKLNIGERLRRINNGGK